jgi:competence protein ComEC
LAFFILYFAVVGLAMTGAFWKEGWRRWSIPGIAMLGLIWAGTLFMYEPKTRITVLPAEGAPVFVDARGSRNDLLIDCSDEGEADYVVKRFLHAQGKGSLRNFVLSHGDIKHVQGFFQLEPEFRPARIFTTAARARSATYRRIISVLEKIPEKWGKVSRGDELAGWRVLHPGLGRGFPRADDNCIVLYAEIDGWRVLDLSDLGARGEDELLRREPELKADIVIAGSHGQGELLSAELVAKLEARAVILGTSRFSPFGRTSRDGSRELRARCPNVLRTSESGAVTISIDGNECMLEPALGEKVVLSK